jgi:FlaA1/EpsC-like NDP-sugar epimerase
VTGISREVSESSRLTIPAPVRTAAAALTDLGDRVGGAPLVGSGWAVRYRRRLISVDAIVIALSVIVASFVEAVRDGFFETITALSSSDTKTLLVTIGYPVGIGLLWAVCLSFQRTRDLSVVGTGADEYKRVLNATILTFVLIALVISITGHQSMRSYFFVALPGGSLGLIASRFLLRRWLIRQRTLGNYLSRAIVVGSRGDVRVVIDRNDEK